MSRMLKLAIRFWPIFILLTSCLIVVFIFVWALLNITFGQASSFQQVIILVFLSIISLLLSSILVMSNNWHKIRQTGALVPEEWGEYLADVSSKIENHVSYSGDNIEINKKIANHILAELKTNSDIMATYAKFMDEKDQKIKDLEIGSNIIIKLSIIESLLSFSNKIGSVTSDISPKNVVILIDEILSKEGVQPIVVHVGDHIDKYDGLIELGEATTDTDATDGQITEVTSPGYFMEGPVRSHVVKKAVVNYHHSKSRG